MKAAPQKLYKMLLKEFGSLNWWPMDKMYHKRFKSDPRFEIIVGAILTQNTVWSNVEKALENLKSERMLDCKKISESNIKTLQKMIKSSGFYKQKADRLRNLASYLQNNYDGELDRFFSRNLSEIRRELLSLNGVGPETADSILLYAGNLPIFVVDAYTKRICKRIPLDVKISYEEIQHYFQTELPKTYKKNELTKIYNELHALIVILAKTYCKKKPDCNNCPIKKYCKKLLQ